MPADVPSAPASSTPASSGPAPSPAPADRRASIGPQRSPDARAAILAAAEAVLLARGAAGFSIEAVAKQARAGKPTVYRWWPSRAALLLEVYHARKTEPAIRDAGSPAADLAAYYAAIFAHWRRDGSGAVFRSVIAEAQGDEAAAAALAAYAADCRARLAALLAAAQARGELAAEARPELLAEMAQSFAWGRLLTDRLDLAETEIAAVVGQILAGAAPR